MVHIIEHSIKDTIVIIPFLFIAFLLMEYIEHKFNKKTKNIIEKSGKLGPLFGSFLGMFPQCGFSVLATKGPKKLSFNKSLDKLSSPIVSIKNVKTNVVIKINNVILQVCLILDFIIPS